MHTSSPINNIHSVSHVLVGQCSRTLGLSPFINPSLFRFFRGLTVGAGHQQKLPAPPSGADGPQPARQDLSSAPATTRQQRSPSAKWTAVVRRSVIGCGLDPRTNEDVGHLVRSIRSPTVQTYTALRRKLAQCSDTKGWMVRFLQADGLALLIEALEKLCDTGVPFNLVDTFLQLECIGCVRAVMNSQTGLDYIIENRDFTHKLAAGKLNLK